MKNQRCHTLPASMIAAPCQKCGIYPDRGELAHIVGAAPEAAEIYCADCCPVCAEERP
jgi:hypothetical protein